MMVKLISEQTKLSRDDIAVIGNTAYIAADSPTRGRKVFIEMIVPASTAMTDATNSAQAILNKVVSDRVLGIFCSNEATWWSSATTPVKHRRTPCVPSTSLAPSPRIRT